MTPNCMTFLMAFFLTLHVGLAPTATAQLSAAELTETIHGMENDLGLKATLERIRQGQIPAEKLAMIYLILESTHEGAIHQLGGATGNRTLLHADGHQEAVVDAANKPVEDGINDGSYNYYHPEKTPLRHFAFDLVPWLLWGNTPHDTTTPTERTSAYLADLGSGIRAAVGKRDRLAALKSTHWADDGQLQALAIFVRVAEVAQVADTFPLFNGATKVSDEQLLGVLEKLQHGFTTVFGF